MQLRYEIFDRIFLIHKNDSDSAILITQAKLVIIVYMFGDVLGNYSRSKIKFRVFKIQMLFANNSIQSSSLTSIPNLSFNNLFFNFNCFMSELDTDGGACFLSENIGCVATNKVGFADTRVSNNDDYNIN